jgi:Rieske 2Fe-2S family protein
MAIQEARNAFETWLRGRSLPQEYYVSQGVYERDLRLLGETQWILADHESRIRNPGDYFLFNFGAESIIVLRNNEREVRAFYNVCRHRGSRICLNASGSAKNLICPYHSWTYDLNGNLRPAQFMPEDFDRSANGLEKCHVRVFQGMIFLNFSLDEPPSFESCTEALRPFLEPHQLNRAKIAYRHNYATKANWKLCVENFLECYHCRTAHKTYCSVHDALKMLASGAGSGSSDKDLEEKFSGVLAAWEAKTAAKGHVVGMYCEGADSDYFGNASRLPISDEALTETVDGKPAAPLMGSLVEYDGGQTGIGFNPVGIVLANNDYAIMFRFTPRGPLETDMECIWLVHEEAVEGRDYDTDRLKAVWDITLQEDATITEDNQLGILSKAYRPGVYSNQERRVSDFVAWYMRRLREVPAASQSSLDQASLSHCNVA